MAEMIEGLNLVLLGGTGIGKSASGNTILGREAFRSMKSSTSVTRDVAVESGTVCGQRVTVYDTPGLFNTEMSEDEIQRKYKEVLQRCESGPCVFLLVIKADRFTEKERKTVEKIEQLLGDERLKKTWILFTRGDKLEDVNMTIEEYITPSEPLKKVVQKYDQRYHVFNNKTRGPSEQARLLLEKITQSLKETVTYTCHYMTDRLERFDLKTSKLDLLKKKRHLHLGCPWVPLPPWLRLFLFLLFSLVNLSLLLACQTPWYMVALLVSCKRQLSLNSLLVSQFLALEHLSNNKNTLGLIYQSNVETSADPSAKINLRQSSRVIYETFLCRQSHCTKDRTLINVAAENNRHLNITPLKTPRFRSHAPKVYDTEKHNPAKKRKYLIKEKLILLQKHPLTL